MNRHVCCLNKDEEKGVASVAGINDVTGRRSGREVPVRN